MSGSLLTTAGGEGLHVHQEDPALRSVSAGASLPSADARLLEQIRSGDTEAGLRFIRDYYPGVYRYLLYLTGRREMAEDLTQETFLQAWRRLETFEGRSALKLWLHRIAHREFLQALRSQRFPVSLEEMGELPAPHGLEWAEAVELRAVIRKLPREEGEVVLLHYLEGYSSSEIARIVGVPAGTVRYRLSMARAHLQRELGEGDLSYLNLSPDALLRRWAWLPLEALIALEGRLSLGSGGWSMADRPAKAKAGPPPSPPEPSTLEDSPSTKGERKMSHQPPTGLSRRQLLEAAGTAAATAAAAGLAGPAAATPQNEAEIIDERLTRKVTLAFKATALADLCEQLHRDTGIRIVAGPSVADEKVTLFCKRLPLREVMRQLSRPFGYTWLRSNGVLGVGGRVSGPDSSDPTPHPLHPTPSAGYRYELVQDLRSQLLEEELRHPDRNTALLVLEREIERFRPYLDLSPDEALARVEGALPEEKHLLEMLTGFGWGPIHMYFRLSAQELAALRAGQELMFNEEPMPGEQPLPADGARGVLQSFRDHRFLKCAVGFVFGPKDLIGPGGLPATAVPEARAMVTVRIKQGELGQFWLGGYSGVFGPARSGLSSYLQDPCAVGRSSAVLTPNNAVVNAKLSRDPALRPGVTVRPQHDRTPPPASRAPGFPAREGESPGLAGDSSGDDYSHPAPSRGGVGSEPKVTSADVLEALHDATGFPIVADYYTRLYPAEGVSLRNQSLFEALNQLSDTMRHRWHKEASAREGGAWLEFRSTTFYDDRLKEVPNRLLMRWAASRRQHGFPTLDDLVEIAQLPDAQLDGAEMAEGARECFGLAEWGLASSLMTRAHLRFLGGFTPTQRQDATSATGLLFTKMSLAQQQQFLSLFGGSDAARGAAPGLDEPLQSLEELAGATLRVEYTQLGWFQWGDPGLASDWTRWVVPIERGPQGRRVLRPPIRERTREAALQAVRQLDPKMREAVLHTRGGLNLSGETAQPIPLEAQIFPSELGLTIIYVPGTSNARAVRVLHGGSNSWNRTVTE